MAALQFSTERFIQSRLDELNAYSSVFEMKIVRAFDNIEDEARRIEEDAYAASASVAGPNSDALCAAEDAYMKGLDYYLAIDAIRQGIINLMVAGLFHLLEQQTNSFAEHELARFVQKPKGKTSLADFKDVVKLLGVNINAFHSFPLLDELRLVSNAVKHGDGVSTEELRKRNPKLFRDEHGNDHCVKLPLRPLTGQGLRLTEDHFKAYKACLDEFWNELARALIPVF